MPTSHIAYKSHKLNRVKKDINAKPIFSPNLRLDIFVLAVSRNAMLECTSGLLST